jgi:formylmethanofuran:tetrahydromethanopterin formyltransferase
MTETLANPETRSLDVTVVDTFAEAFAMTAARAIVTADSRDWARIAAQTMSGYATSVIACDAEAGIERELATAETPDGRPALASWSSPSAATHSRRPWPVASVNV